MWDRMCAIVAKISEDLNGGEDLIVKVGKKWSKSDAFQNCWQHRHSSWGIIEDIKISTPGSDDESSELSSIDMESEERASYSTVQSNGQ